MSTLTRGVRSVGVLVRPTETQVMLLMAVVVGLGAGFGAVGFRELIAFFTWFFFAVIGAHLSQGGRLYLLLIPALGALLFWPIIRYFAPEAKGHGVPEVMEAVSLRGGRIRPHVVIAKALASAINIGSGGSVGREGPIVQIGSALGSTVGQRFKMSDERIKTLVAAGAAAGIAATFNAPFAGAFFALEVILDEFSISNFSTVVVGVTITKVKGKTVLSGFTIEDAPLAGISVQQSSGVVISNNVVQGNDKNLDDSDPQNPTCNGALFFDEQDCGEAINLNSVVSSVVQSNLVQNNAGGILLSDDFGKNHANVVEDNGIQNNFSPPGFLACGVTLASHPNAFGTDPIVPGSGVFKNTIIRNSSTNNGCGIGFFDSSPGTKTYDNTVSQNVLAGNGLAGIAMHAIGTGQDMSGNQLAGNWIGLNNTLGDAAAGDTQTTGVLAWSVISSVQGLVIKNNNIVGGNHFGIFIAGPIQAKVTGNEIDAAVHEHKG